ncbi:UDP-N-acetylmuramoyl-L-alanine--D-glutamate ligase [Terrisporobacter petrolearius]|uniref:UDP-N-acetylmuramoyl-L-alanine--D-glutamate ligase n=1 Tax=Terrisporobacter petrolearius TaxID=1460447 RepID=UPI0031CC8286
MNLKNKNILLVGLAKTGVSTIKLLNKLEANIIVNDIKNEEKLKDILLELKDIKNAQYILGYHPENVDHIDLAVVSPGVPLDLPFILKLKENNIEIIGEVELAYRLSKNPVFVGITGTNGKTTTTSLVGEIFNSDNKDTYIVGNIGNPVIDTVETTTEDSYLITELSSFQLESIVDFKPKVASILNFSPDHLNRHHTMENYIAAKANIFKNQDKSDFAILNYDDKEVRRLESNCNGQVIFFSRKEKLDKCVYLDENNNIVIHIDKKIVLLNKKELSLPGAHNLENCMAAIAMSYVCNVDLETLKHVLKTFKAVEHRLEYVRTLNDIMFVNDSKGTNPDSTVKAITSYENPIILIAGGYNKESDFNELLEVGKENIKALVLMGETSSIIEKSAKEKDYKTIIKVNNMKEAVEASYNLAESGDVVLLSPACASWDMYKSFEVRGRDFKENVNNLK